MKNTLKWVAIIFVGFIIIGVIFGDNSSQTEVNVDESSSEQIVVSDSSQTEASVDENPSEQLVVADSSEVADTSVADIAQEEAKPEGLSRPQKNAVRSAEQYINMTGFSREGLIEQLSSEYGDGYGIEDATIAIDSLNIDWNEQAVRSAEEYLDMTGFSCDGLIEQLSSSAGSKYTVSEANYGAQQAGACS